MALPLPPNVVPRYAEGQFRGVVTGSELLDITTGKTIKFADLVAGSGPGGDVTVDAITDAGTAGKAVLKAADVGAVQTAVGASAVGKAVLVATDQAAARSAIGAGTSNVKVGTAATDALAGNTVIPPAYTLPAASATVVGGVKQAVTQAASTATDVAGVVADLNALIVKIKAAGQMA